MTSDEKKIGGYEDLVVWQRGIGLVKKVYQLSRVYPDDEKFGLVAQMRRAAVSIPSNIAEGQARHTTKEFVRFISNAEGSLAELDTQLRIAIELGDSKRPDTADVFQELKELRKMLNGLRRSLVTRHSSLVT